MKLFKNTILLVFLSLSLFSLISLSSAEQTEIDFFYMNGCGACAQMEPLLEGLQEKYEFKLNSYETSKNSALFSQKLEEHNVPAERRGYVPAVFIKDKYFIGYSSDITSAIEQLLQGQEIENGDNLFGDTVKTKVLGLWNVNVSFKDKSLLASTLILGFLDSLNVCSITILIFLIIYSLSIGSLRRAFKLGLVFTSIIFLFYFLFMVALTSLISSLITNFGFQIRLAVILLSFFAGILLVKDYFFYGKWLSLKVPDSAKTILEKYIKQGTIVSTIIFALLASLVELPCTAIFPLIYSTILANQEIIGISRIFWIALYNLIYILPLLVIVFGTYFSWTRIRDVDMEMEKLKKIFKLIAGVALILIAFYFVWPLLFAS